jgi:hypothetical protein
MSEVHRRPLVSAWWEPTHREMRPFSRPTASRYRHVLVVPPGRETSSSRVLQNTHTHTPLAHTHTRACVPLACYGEEGHGVDAGLEQQTGIEGPRRHLLAVLLARSLSPHLHLLRSTHTHTHHTPHTTHAHTHARTHARTTHTRNTVFRTL